MRQMINDHLPDIIDQVCQSLNCSQQNTQIFPKHGGSIHSAFHIRTHNTDFFLKTNHKHCQHMFSCEVNALKALSACTALKIPQPILVGSISSTSFLAMEYIPMQPHTSASSWKRFGSALAELHKMTQDSFGWHEDNYIGSTKQPNGFHDDWCDFLRENRLNHQLKLAISNHLPERITRQCRKLVDHLEDFFDRASPVSPSLLHGDLWSGNQAADPFGQPVIFDPATYFGDREADLAMTELFGGFDMSFYESYQENWPLEEGYHRRKHLYNLYHLLNHFNLFGSSYLTRIEQVVSHLLTEI
ncbi:MAG: fructosamine kinase family protein [Gammaproteobacteria bacterium]|nr:MAG: fructosamine kinase family protein [Gammaproteobacteria bacterium]